MSGIHVIKILFQSLPNSARDWCHWLKLFSSCCPPCGCCDGCPSGCGCPSCCSCPSGCCCPSSGGSSSSCCRSSSCCSRCGCSCWCPLPEGKTRSLIAISPFSVTTRAWFSTSWGLLNVIPNSNLSTKVTTLCALTPSSPGRPLTITLSTRVKWLGPWSEFLWLKQSVSVWGGGHKIMTLDSQCWITICPNSRPGSEFPTNFEIMDAISMFTVPDSSSELSQWWSYYKRWAQSHFYTSEVGWRSGIQNGNFGTTF